MLGTWRQPPAYSPLSVAAIGSAAVHALRVRQDPRPYLAQFLLKRYAAQWVVLYGSGTEALLDALGIAERMALSANVSETPPRCSLVQRATNQHRAPRLRAVEISPPRS